MKPECESFNYSDNNLGTVADGGLRLSIDDVREENVKKARSKKKVID